MNIKLKALLIAISIPILMGLFVYTLVFHIEYIAIIALFGVIFALYKLILTDLEEREQRKKK